MQLDYKKICKKSSKDNLFKQLLNHGVHMTDRTDSLSFYFRIKKVLRKTVQKGVDIECTPDNNIHLKITNKSLDEQDLNLIADKLIDFALIMDEHGYIKV